MFKKLNATPKRTKSEQLIAKTETKISASNKFQTMMRTFLKIVKCGKMFVHRKINKT